jgi:hypothetical protein
VHGCRGQAVRTLAAGHEDGHGAQVAGSIAGRGHRMAAADRRVGNTVRGWSRCMAADGHPCPDPLAALGDRRFPGRRVRGQERRTALADIRCKKKTGLLDVRFSTGATIHKELIGKEHRILRELEKAHAAKAEAARAILARG